MLVVHEIVAQLVIILVLRHAAVVMTRKKGNDAMADGWVTSSRQGEGASPVNDTILNEG